MKNLANYLLEIAEKFPDKIAFCDSQHSISYSELFQKAQAIASCLAKNSKIHSPYVVLTDRSVESICLCLGVALSGNFYAPFDKSQPIERLRSICSVLSPLGVVYTKTDSGIADQLNVQVKVSYEEMIDSPIQGDDLFRIWADLADNDPLCCIFTSGSTGVPKGVLKSHASMICMAEKFSEFFNITSNDVFASQASLDFDVSNKSFYLPLINGCSVYILTQQQLMFPAKLVSLLQDKSVTTCIWAASALNVVANLHALNKIQPSSIKRVMFSGETLPVKTLNYWRSKLPSVYFYNLYGPTEMTGNATCHFINTEFSDEDVIPIGKALPNTKVLLINENGCQINNPDVIGEIYIGGNCLALGYYNDADKTSQTFVQNPINSYYPEILYKTGDLGKYSCDGNLIYVGRKDQQIKHMGHRIELGEIEVTANAVTFVKNACCVYDAIHSKIYLFYESDHDCYNDISEKLKDSLPSYMKPQKIVRLDVMPMNSHGKIDRLRLKTDYL